MSLADLGVLFNIQIILFPSLYNLLKPPQCETNSLPYGWKFFDISIHQSQSEGLFSNYICQNEWNPAQRAEVIRSEML